MSSQAFAPSALQGVVKAYNSHRGFGFIKMRDGKDLFFHISACTEGFEPQEGDKVLYHPGESNHAGKTRPCATFVAPLRKGTN